MAKSGRTGPAERPISRVHALPERVALNMIFFVQFFVFPGGATRYYSLRRFARNGPGMSGEDYGEGKWN